MSYTKRIVCLANSRKLSGRCVAGKELLPNAPPGSWIRPVSNRPKQELSLAEQSYTNGGGPHLLDLVEMTLQAPMPVDHQVENHLIDTAHHWVRTGAMTWHDLDAALDNFNGSLWIDGHSSYNGTNDRIPEAQCVTLGSSLKLMEVHDLVVSVALEGLRPKRTVRARFSGGGKLYAFGVTDPVAEALYLGKADGDYPVGTARLCISVGEPFEAYCYKLVAGIITP